jgi:hypothetical protein
MRDSKRIKTVLVFYANLGNRDDHYNLEEEKLLEKFAEYSKKRNKQ